MAGRFEKPKKEIVGKTHRNKRLAANIKRRKVGRKEKRKESTDVYGTTKGSPTAGRAFRRMTKKTCHNVKKTSGIWPFSHQKPYKKGKARGIRPQAKFRGFRQGERRR